MLKQIWTAISLAGLVFGADILQLSYSDDKKEAIPLGTFEIDSTPEGKLTVKTVDLQKVETSGQYCLNAEIEGKLDMPCFSNMKLGMPLRYDLIVDVDDNNEINQLSLSYNEKNDAIVGVVRYPETGPSAPVAKLKKKTKTYADKKASKNKDGSTAQFEEDDEEVKEVSWFQKNWKMMVLGLLIYNFVVGSMKKKQQAPASGQKTE
ncbi:YDR056C [Saccharomyces arboricola H-6]|uniref:YDR056C n=1 Tax=Saccharomyces arboricola (strain H-6 / AS 2.3317 / CBS 10644) TaxID=1160507 RepID=J8Q3L8_SACAR|nr:YDR056C [Saccharomyces arboricola H-6]